MARILAGWFAVLAMVWLSISCVPGNPVPDGNTENDNVGNDTPPANSRLALFDDPETDFATMDVYDVDDEIVNFDLEAMSIIWAEDQSTFDEGLWDVDGNLLLNGFFQVRFGNKDGRRRAFFTETDTATICDLQVQEGELFIFPTSEPVPQ